MATTCCRTPALLPSGPTARGRRGRFSGLSKGAFAGFLSAIVAVVLIATVSYATVRRTQDNADRVARTLEVLDHVQTLSSTLKDAETGQRGFLLTQDANYLEPYVSARSSVDGEFSALKTLVIKHD